MANNRLSSVPGSKARVSPSMMSAQEAAATRAMMKSVRPDDAVCVFPPTSGAADRARQLLCHVSV